MCTLNHVFVMSIKFLSYHFYLVHCNLQLNICRVSEREPFQFIQFKSELSVVNVLIVNSSCVHLLLPADDDAGTCLILHFIFHPFPFSTRPFSMKSFHLLCKSSTSTLMKFINFYGAKFLFLLNVSIFNLLLFSR